MWSRGRDANEHGEPVLLLQTGGGRRGHGGHRHKEGSGRPSPSSSHIGGLPCHHEKDALLSSMAATPDGGVHPKCALCRNPMYLLMQLHAPLDAVDRTLYVFGCNDASCYSGKGAKKNSESEDTQTIARFHACIGTDDNGGALRCYRSQQRWEASSEEKQKPDAAIDAAPPTGCNLEGNDWGMDDGSDGWGDGADDWGGGEGDSTTMGDLEALLTNCEMKAAAKQGPAATENAVSVSPAKPPVPTSVTGDAPKKDTPPSFDQYPLEMINEPPTGNGGDSDEDGDDNAGCANTDSSKVQQMLSRYLDAEDDEDILSALKGGGGNGCVAANGNGKDGGGGERYERLPPDERAFLAFSNRLKRVPGQVARYAYGGEPLWSVPLPPKHSGKQQSRSKQQKAKKKAQKPYSPMPDVPNCVCGAERVFEVQLIPSLLHALDVDSYANDVAADGDVMDLISTGGMNWGSCAVYSCSQSCEQCREEFIIYQDSCFDEQVKRNEGAKGDDG
ncbi:hypothetical protein ACHAXT_007090 [Thalassiosira profunda]